MSFGIHTFKTRLDLISLQALADFKTWNNDSGLELFAGRNFLGGDFIWGHSEATNSSLSPDPYDLNLDVNVGLIAPIQAPQPSRQSQTGFRGRLYGGIDAHAICQKIYQSYIAGEFKLPPSNLVNIWLAVDPKESLSKDYWAWWSSYVNEVTFGPPLFLRPFRACIFCSYQYVNFSPPYRRDPKIGVVLEEAAKHYSSVDTTVHSFWAFAPEPHLSAHHSSKSLSWNEFILSERPDLWNFTNTAPGLPSDISKDAVRPKQSGESMSATDYMLIPQKWQPSGNNIQNMGFSGTDEITATGLTCMQKHPIPAIPDRSFRFSSIKRQDGKPNYTNVIGRYLLRIPDQDDQILRKPEALRISNSGIKIFSIWQRQRGAVTSGDPNYFNPNLNNGKTGELDGKETFEYCGDTLSQPPQTPIFFAVDSGVPHKEWIIKYFEGVKKARDEYAQINPDYFYLIGVYGNGRTLEWCYDQGIASFFWQATSPGSAGSGPPRFPWYHANRWQYYHSDGDPWKDAKWKCAFYAPPNPVPVQDRVRSADVDADWGNGGIWSYKDPFAYSLEKFHELEKQKALKLLTEWADIIGQKFGSLLNFIHFK